MIILMGNGEYASIEAEVSGGGCGTETEVSGGGSAPKRR